MEKAKNIFLKYWKHIAIVILLIFVFFQCNSNHKLEVDNSDLKSKVEANKQLADIYIQKNNYLAEIEEKHNDTIESLKKEISIGKSKIIEVRKNSNLAIEKVKKYTRSQMADYFVLRYEFPGAKTIENGTCINDTMAKKVIVELVEKDSLVKELDITNDILFDTERVSEQKSEIIKIEKEKNVNLTSGISELNKAIDSQNTIIKNTEKQLKHEKNKKTFWKITTGIGLFASSYLLLTH